LSTLVLVFTLQNYWQLRKSRYSGQCSRHFQWSSRHRYFSSRLWAEAHMYCQALPPEASSGSSRRYCAESSAWDRRDRAKNRQPP